VSKKKRKTKITKEQRIKKQIELFYKSCKEYRKIEYELVQTGDRLVERIFELEEIMRGEYDEDGK